MTSFLVQELRPSGESEAVTIKANRITVDTVGFLRLYQAEELVAAYTPGSWWDAVREDDEDADDLKKLFPEMDFEVSGEMGTAAFAETIKKGLGRTLNIYRPGDKGRVTP